MKMYNIKIERSIIFERPFYVHFSKDSFWFTTFPWLVIFHFLISTFVILRFRWNSGEKWLESAPPKRNSSLVDHVETEILQTWFNFCLGFQAKEKSLWKLKNWNDSKKSCKSKKTISKKFNRKSLEIICRARFFNVQLFSNSLLCFCGSFSASPLKKKAFQLIYARHERLKTFASFRRAPFHIVVSLVLRSLSFYGKYIELIIQ